MKSCENSPEHHSILSEWCIIPKQESRGENKPFPNRTVKAVHYHDALGGQVACGRVGTMVAVDIFMYSMTGDDGYFSRNVFFFSRGLDF